MTFVNVSNGWVITPHTVAGEQKWLLVMSGQAGIELTSGGNTWLNEDYILGLNWRDAVNMVAPAPPDNNPKFETTAYFIPEQWTNLVTLNKGCCNSNYNECLIHSWDVSIERITDCLGTSYNVYQGIAFRISHTGGDGSHQSLNIGFHATIYGRIADVTIYGAE